jgi:teichuronic acid biosynthesis glycosyltransferase TuaC
MTAISQLAPLHVLTITPFFPSRENEVNGCFIAEPIERMSEMGVRSSVFAVSPIHRPARLRSSKFSATWVRYPQIPGNLGLATAGSLLYTRMLRLVEKLASEQPIDLIHAHGALPCGDAARLLGKRLQIPFTVTVHGLDVFNACGGGVAEGWRRSASLRVYEAAKRVICISGRVREILEAGNLANGRSVVVHNGVDEVLFSPGENASEIDPEILVVGNLIPSKGQELVLRAVSRLANSHPKLRCRMIGEGPERMRLEGLAGRLGISPRMEFAGRKSRREVARAMQRCTIFALPSRSEGLGCVYLEAMACAKPAIACRGQGIEDVIEHEKNGWLIPVDGLEELVGGLSMLLSSSELSARIAKAARAAIVERFTLEAQARHLAKVYEDVRRDAGRRN